MFADIDDISVDVPSAPMLLQQIVTKLKTAGTLSAELADELHSRSACIQLTIIIIIIIFL